VQGARVLSLVRRPPHDRTGCTPGRPVWPEVPVRQRVLTLPPRVRYVLAWRHDLCTSVARVLHRAVHGTCGRGHRRGGWARPEAARSSSCSALGALNLNVHLHALVLDGVFARGADGRLRFHRPPAPTAADVTNVLAAIVPSLRARLARQSLDDDGESTDRFADATPLLAGLVAASALGVLVVGGVPERQPERLGGAGWAPLGRRPAVAGPETPHARWRGSICMPGWRSRATGRGGVRLSVLPAPAVTGDRLAVDADGRAIPGRTERRNCASNRSPSSSGWRRWCRGR
jgi:hypothetical protein